MSPERPRRRRARRPGGPPRAGERRARPDDASDDGASIWALVSHRWDRPFSDHTGCFAALVAVQVLARDPVDRGEACRRLLHEGAIGPPLARLRALELDPTDDARWRPVLVTCLQSAASR